jgi:hypothetical protein
MRWPTEDRFRQSREVDLLSEMIRVLVKQFVIVDMVRECIVSGQVATVECKNEVAKPRVIFVVRERIEDRM